MSLTLLEPIIVNTSASFTFASVTVVNNANVGNLRTNNLLYANGEPYVFTTNAVGGNRQVQFNDDGPFGASSNFTFNKSTNTLSVTNIIANGNQLTNLNASNVVGTVNSATQADVANSANSVSGSNVSGQVANALVAGTVYTNAQPNITSVGTLTGLNVTGNANVGNIGATNGVFTNVSGNGNQLTNLNASNIVGQVANALVAGTVYTNAQPNITSVGSLTNLDVSGNAIVGGNLTVNGNLTYINVDTLRIQDPVIELGGSINGAALTSNDGKDRGSLLHYYSGQAVDAFMGWDNSNSEFAFGSNISISGEVVTFNNFGNVRANHFIGNGSQLTSITGANVTGTVASASQANTANSATVANSVAGANVSGQVANALVAGTVYTNAQPNITSVGLLTSLSVGPNSSVTLTGTTGFVRANSIQGIDGVNAIFPGYNTVSGAVGIQTNLIVGVSGTGNLTVPNVTTTGSLRTDNLQYANGSAYVFNTAAGANTQVQFNNNNIFAGSANFTFNSVTNTLSVTNIIANGSQLTNLTAGNVSGQVANALVAGTVYTSAQPNITSVGTLTTVTVSGNANVGNIGATNAVFTNVSGNGNQLTNLNANNITSGTLSNARLSGSYTINISGSATTAGTVTTNAQPNITSVGTLSSLNVTGNANVGNIGATNGVFTNVSGNGSSLSSLTAGNIVGQVANALVAGTVYTNAQPNITSVGTLTNANISGTVTAVNITANTGVFTGNGAALTNLNANNITSGTLSNARLSGSYTINISGSATTAGTVTTNAQPNITSVGTLTALTVTGNANVGNIGATNAVFTNVSGNGNQLTNLNASNISGQVANALVAGTVYTNAQPNITSVGTLTGIDVTGNTIIQQSQERFTTLTGATGTVVHNFANGGIFVHSSISANFTANITNLPNATGRASVVTLILQQGATGRFCNAVTIGGTTQTIRWLGGAAPVPTNNAIDVEVFTIFQTGASTYIVLGQLGTFN
jgi:hypothetical protein